MDTYGWGSSKADNRKLASKWGHVHMTSAHGGGKKDETGQGKEGCRANLDGIFLYEINSAWPYKTYHEILF